ncbi:MAG: hypothetical protein AB8G11_10205 [Saprospiraceae bacterium]
MATLNLNSITCLVTSDSSSDEFYLICTIDNDKKNTVRYPSDGTISTKPGTIIFPDPTLNVSYTNTLQVTLYDNEPIGSNVVGEFTYSAYDGTIPMNEVYPKGDHDSKYQVVTFPV